MKYSLIYALLFTSMSLIPALAQATAEVGLAAPDFTLKSYQDEPHSLSSYADKTVVLEWFAHDCEFTASHYDKGKDGHMQKLQSEFTGRGVVWLTIDSNRNALPPAEMDALAKKWKMHSTAFLSDLAGGVGIAYGVIATPQVFVIHKGELVYQGAVDDRSSFFSLLRDRSTALNYIRQALEEVSAGKPVSVPETKPYGCAMKYAK